MAHSRTEWWLKHTGQVAHLPQDYSGDIIRQKRIWYPGATYHAMARGIRRMVIFQDDTDYQVFLLLLKKMMEKHECKSKKKIINLQICFPLKKD